jgi:excisionase family DNA binding protein
MVPAIGEHPIRFTIKEICEQRYQGKISEATIWRLVRSGQLKAYRLSPRRLLISLEELEKYEASTLGK